MKQCPKCNSTCADEDIICKSCGYLFTPSGFEGDETSQGAPGNTNGAPSQGNFNNVNGVPPQNGFINPNGAPPQNGLNNQYGIPPQNNINNQNSVPPQNNFYNPNVAPPQNDFNNPYNAPQGDFNNSYAPQQGNYDSWQDKNHTPQYPNNFQEPKTNGFSIASLVLGICGIVFSCCYALGIFPAIISLVFGIISSKKIKASGGTQSGSGMSIAGIILSCFGILLSIVFGIIYIYILTHPREYANWMQQYMQTYRSYYGSSSSF